MSEQSSEGYRPSLAEGTSSSDESLDESSRNPGIESREPQQRSRKRKADYGFEARAIVKKQSSLYLPSYHELFNATVTDINGTSDSEADQWYWHNSRIGLSWWTASEKQLFFTALDRKGVLDIRAISRAIETKSEPEVQSFILELQEGYAQQHRRRDGTGLSDYSDHAASFEVSVECEEALEAAADGLAQRQARVEEAVEKTRHAELWLLTTETERDIDISKEAQLTNATIEAAASVLHLSNMLKLSCRVFMNSVDENNNWQSYVDDGRQPSIYATAFIDMYNLVLGVTKRIISSAIFLATSRLEQQAMIPGTQGKRVIRRLDVQSACEILRLKDNSKQYWTKFPRRCNIEVVDDSLQPMSYDNVEQLLGTGTIDHDVDGSGSATGDYSYVDMSSLALSHDGQHVFDSEEDERAELLDAVQNLEEESRLLDMLGYTNEKHATIKTEEIATVLPNRKPGAPMALWQNKLSYKAEWQLYGGPPDEEQFLTRQRQSCQKQPRRDQPSPSSSLGGISEHPEVQLETFTTAGAERHQKLVDSDTESLQDSAMQIETLVPTDRDGYGLIVEDDTENTP